jgi:hypothetical protein
MAEGSWQQLAEANGAEAGRRAEEVNALRAQLRGAVEEREVFARALRMACGSADVRESCVRQARAALARERGQ